MPLDRMDANVIDRKYLYGRSILCFQDYNQMMDAFASNSRTSAKQLQRRHGTPESSSRTNCG